MTSIRGWQTPKGPFRLREPPRSTRSTSVVELLYRDSTRIIVLILTRVGDDPARSMRPRDQSSAACAVGRFAATVWQTSTLLQAPLVRRGYSATPPFAVSCKRRLRAPPSSSGLQPAR